MELIPLARGEERLFLILNHSDREQRVGLSDGSMRDLIGGGAGDQFLVPKFDVVLLQGEPARLLPLGDEEGVEAAV
jgi:hypothetical protein